MTIDFSVLISTTLTMLILICTGYGIAKTGLLNDAFSKKLSALIITIAQPALMVSSLINVEFSRERLLRGCFVVALSAGVHIVCVLVATAVTVPLKRVGERQILRYAMVFSNCAFFGFPVLRAVFGDEGVFWGSFYCIVFNIVMWTWGMFALSRANPEIKMNAKKMFLNLGTIPCVIGIVLYVSRLGAKLPTPVTASLGYLSGLCTPVSMLIIGGALSRIPIRKIFLTGKAYLHCAVKLLLLPAIVGALAFLVGLDREMICLAALMAGMPTAATTSAFAERYDVEPELSSVCVGLSTVLSVGTIPLVLLVFGA